MARRSSRRTPKPLIAAAAALLAAAILPVGGASADLQSDIATQVQQFLDIGKVAVPPADCGPGSRPETGMQGDVPAADRASGRSTQGYSCNMSFVGGYAGHGAGITSTTYDHCSYTGSFFPGDLLGPAQGVQVIDASDPAHPVLSTTLAEPAMMAGTWESLKVNTARNLLVGTGGCSIRGRAPTWPCPCPSPPTRAASPPTAGPIGPRASHPASSARSTSPIRRIRT
jgi:hypothetical protein